MNITENELLAALADASQQPAPPDAMTADELQAALGIGRTTLRRRLALLKQQGRLLVWHTTRPDVAGRPHGMPAYTIKPAVPNGTPTPMTKASARRR